MTRVSAPPHPGDLSGRPTTTSTPNRYYDEYFPLLTHEELKVLLYITRRTYGFQRDDDRISLSQITDGLQNRAGQYLDRGANVNRTSAVKALRSLAAFGLIVVVDPGDPRRHIPPSYGLQLDFRQVDEAAIIAASEARSAKNTQRTLKATERSTEKRKAFSEETGTCDVLVQEEATSTCDVPRTSTCDVPRTSTCDVPPCLERKGNKVETTTTHNGTSVHADSGGGGGEEKRIHNTSAQSGEQPTPTEQWLLDQNVSPAKARTFAHLDLAAVQADWKRRMDTAERAGRPIGPGAILSAWTSAPPRIAATAPKRVETDEERLARERRVYEQIISQNTYPRYSNG